MTPELDLKYLVAFIALVLPGVIASYVFRLRVPMEDQAVKGRVAETVSFSLLNLSIVFPVVALWFSRASPADSIWVLWLLGVCCFIIVPSILGFVAAILRERIENTGVTLGRHRTAFDAVFGLRKGLWLIVELTDGRLVGGRFGRGSYATTFPSSGDLYIEELWTVTDDGFMFEERSEGNPGIILKSSEYRYIKVFLDDERVEAAIA